MWNVLALIVAIIVAVVAGGYLGWQGRKIFDRQTELERKVDDLMEIVKRRRLPYPTAAGLEDAIAIAIEILDRNQAERVYENTRINQLAEQVAPGEKQSARI